MSSGTGIIQKSSDLVNIDPAVAYSVTELSQNIKQFFSATPQFNDILLKGEVSNFVRAASGHIYFNLRDENCVIACAFFRPLQTEGCSNLEEGIQVVATGSLVVYEPRSQYQLSIKKVMKIGNGISSLKLKRLKEKLEAEGLFNQDRKKPIPRLPRKVGIITSKDSAAVRDILSVVNLRCPKMNLVMAYVTLQGDGAPESIVLALSSLTEKKDVDAIILTRGGGPSEDFMAFNDEKLVRAIASSTKPIITGIGHESDVCLADLASDFRASTPSTAARAAIPDSQELENSLLLLKQDVERSYKFYLDAKTGKSDLVKYKAAIIVLIALLVLVILMILLRG
jgi:exodeoxyribonuclease VII large subunit